MDIFITEIKTGFRLALSLLPDRIIIGGDTAFQTYEIINIGEIRIPKGVSLLEYSWQCTLPGAKTKAMSHVKTAYWRSPTEIINLWEKWRNSGTKLRLMITGTPVNRDVILASYTASPFGGSGDYDYDINFIQAKSLVVYSVSELSTAAKPVSTGASTTTRPPAASSTAKTYTVKPGDSLWSIAQKELGNGSRYMEIYNLNKNKIKDPRVIQVGWVLTMPAK